MYESFYKLQPTPFRLTPDPHFFYESETHKRGLAYLRFAFYQREGFVAITGAPGTGKTELTLNLIDELPDNKITLAKIVTTNLDADDLLDLVAASFQIDSDHMSKGSELKRLEDFFISQARIGKQVLLIIDEAHNLSVKSLLELSMLENFQLNEKPLMQCFLLGQLPLEEKLNLPELEPLKQRVIASARLESLDQQDTREYIIHRLSKSGWKNNPVIDDEAFLFIYHYTHGVPRKINSLCNRLLLHSYVENRHEIDATTVNTVIQEIQEEAVGESLDLDFSQLQSSVESASNSQHHADKQPALPKENKAQHAAISNNRISNSNNKTDKRKNPDKPVYIPEFLRKTSDENTSTQLKVLEKIREPGTTESHWSNPETTRGKRYDTRRNANRHSGNSSVATAQHVTHQHTYRSSNLLDKELQFLASLAESNIFATIPEQKPQSQPAPKTEVKETQPVENKAEQKTVPIREVIIDESVYGDDVPVSENERKVIIDESAYDEDEMVDSRYENDWQESETRSPLINDRRLTAIAAVVVGSLIVSISWLYHGNPESTNIVTEKQSEINNSDKSLAESEVFADNPPVDIELPVVSATNANPETTHIESNTDTASVPSSIETIVTTASATETSDSSSSSDSGELDTQLTQILERTGVEDIEPPKANDKGAIETADSDNNKSDAPKVNNPSKLAALSIDKHSASPKQDNTTADTGAVKNTLRNNSNKKPITNKHKSQPVTGSTASVPQQTNKPNLPVVESSTKSLLNNSTEPGSSSVTLNTQGTNATGTSISMPNTRRDSITHRPEPPISNADLTTLLSRLSDAYQTGNLQELVNTFASDIISSDGSNRRQILKEYQRLFNITDRRQLAIQDVKWSTKDRQMLGEGNFEVLIREKGATKYTTYQGKISFAVAKESDTVVIKKLDYDYGQ